MNKLSNFSNIFELKNFDEVENELILNTSLNNFIDIVFICDRKGSFTFINSQWTNITGYNEEETIGKNFSDFIYKEDTTFLLKQYSESYKSKNYDIKAKINVVRKDSSSIWLDMKAKTVLKNSKIVGFVGKLFKVVEKNDELQEYNKNKYNTDLAFDLLNNLIDCIPNSVYVKDNQGKYVLANKAFANNINQNNNNIIGKTDFDLGITSEKMFDDISKVLNYGNTDSILRSSDILTYKTFNKSKSGQNEASIFEENTLSFRNVQVAVGTSVSNKNNEYYFDNLSKEIQSKLSITNQINDSIPIAIIRTDLNSKIIFANDEVFSIFEFKNIFEFNQFGLENVFLDSEFFETYNKVLKKTNQVKEQEIEVYTKNEKIKQVMFTCKYNMNDKGKLCIDIFIQDVSIIKNQINELKKAINEYEGFKSALDNLLIIAITDNKGSIIYANDKFVALSGYNLKELIGQNHRLLKSGYHKEDFYKNLWSTITSGKTWREDIKNKAKNGTYYWVDTSIAPMFFDDDKPMQFLSLRYDITARKYADEMLHELKYDLLDAQNIGKIGNYKYKLCTKNLELSDQICEILGINVNSTNNFDVFFDNVIEQDKSILKTMYLHSIEKDDNIEIKYKFQRSNDAKVVVINHIAKVIKDENGRNSKIIGIIQDITNEEKFIEEKEKKFKFLEAINDFSFKIISNSIKDIEEKILGILEYTSISTNSENALVFWYNNLNKNTEKLNFQLLKSYSKSNSISNELYASLFDFEVFHEYLDVLQTGNYVEIRINDLKKNEKYKNVLLNYRQLEIKSIICLPLYVNETLKGILIFTSSHSSKTWDIELINNLFLVSDIIANSLIRKENEENIQNLIFKLQKANTEKDRFFSILAHDLKSPFTGFLGLLDAMQSDKYEISYEDMKSMSSSMFKSAKSLYDLLENLLQWAMAQSKSSINEKSKFDLVEMIEKNINLHKSNLENKKIKIVFDFEQNLEILADSNKIDFVIRNLISNAIKFTHPEKNIHIKVFKNDSNMRFEIKDEGIGMSDEIKEKLFRVGHKTLAVGTAKEKGTGLGLVLCKEYIDLHLGNLWFESIFGQGSTFYFEIPN